MRKKLFQKSNGDVHSQQYDYLQKTVRYRVAITFFFACITIVMTYFHGFRGASLYFMCTLASMKDIGDLKFKIVQVKESLKMINEAQGKKERYDILQKEFPFICIGAVLCVVICGLFIHSTSILVSILFIFITISFITSAFRMNVLRKLYQEG